MRRNTTVSTLYVRSLYHALQSAGIAGEAVFRILNITQEELNSPDIRIPIQRLGDMWQTAIQVTENPLLGLYAGSHVTPADYGIIGHMALAADTLEDALLTGLDYEHLINDSYQTDPIRVGDITYNRLTCQDLDPELAIPLVEFDFAALISFAKSAAGFHQAHLVKPTEVHFSHARRGALEEYERILGAPIKFDMEYNQVVIPQTVLDLPTRSPDPSMLTLIQQRMQAMDEAYNSQQQSIAMQVSRFILDNIETGFPNVEQISEALQISSNTLKRRLSKEGYSYLALTTRLKRDLAESLLKENTSISEIALILGFSETSAFTRAFKKWTGLAPSQFGKS